MYDLGSRNFETMFTNPRCVTSHTSHVTCHMSRVTCHMSNINDKKKVYNLVELVGGGSVINGAYPDYFC